jgi:hypothetical protein
MNFFTMQFTPSFYHFIFLRSKCSSLHLNREQPHLDSSANGGDKVRLSVSNRVMEKFDAGRFDLKMLTDMEVKISNRFVAFENLGNNVNIK